MSTMKGERLLVVDDDPAVLGAIRPILESTSYQVWTATDGDEALELLTRQPFDLVLLDIVMPRVGGLTVLQEVTRRAPDVPVVLMTAHGTLRIAVEAMGHGAQGFLIKPFDLDNLLATLDNALEKRRLREENARARAYLPLLRLNQALFSEISLDRMTEQALEIVSQALNANLAMLVLWSEAADARPLVKHFASSRPADGESLLKLQTWLHYCGQNSERDLFWYNATRDDPQALLKEPDLRSLVSQLAITDLLCVSLKQQEQVGGLMCLARTGSSSPFGPLDAEMMRALGRQALTTLKNILLYETVIASRRRWKATFDAITDGISIHDQEFTILQANQTLEHMLNIPLEKLIGQKCYRVFHGLERHPVWCPHQRTLTEGVVETVETDGPQPGSTFLISTYPLSDAQCKVTASVHVFKDITQRKREQEQLFQSEKLAALGRLAASLAHEINNPLQALNSGLRLLSRPGLDEKKRQQYLTIAGREVERLIGIVERMGDFYRPSTDGLSPTDIHAVLDEILTLARKKLQHSHVTVQRDWATDLPPVNAVADQLKQVFLNLILNAVDAMPEGGTLVISTGCSKDDLAIYVRFADTGDGIAAEHLDHVFEPFFTTRPQGTGLGLSISYNIIQQQGGHIRVESQPGQGATFSVNLPFETKGD